ncbi:coiled-coil domain-containing protein 115-like [Anoplophora glabripennis]|uniref:coiled-coil domain-containing protein 115-like n=1 Tax=Anoplophora glabripennis TaxID=217634 RepID=UPI0008756EBB|nr:coiled-coil domain-containing protein 115-like [Anoplophora glabripennis]
MAQDTEDLDRICDTLDKLTLDALTLMEEKIKLTLNTENAMCGGEAHLAKARYIMGQNNVSSLQLPTENSPDFMAVAKVYSNEEEKLFGQTSYELHLTQKSEETVQDPIRWFGILVPQNLNYAQNMFRQALQWAVQAVNVQTQLKETIEKIYQLKEVKTRISAK